MLLPRGNSSTRPDGQKRLHAHSGSLSLRDSQDGLSTNLRARPSTSVRSPLPIRAPLLRPFDNMEVIERLVEGANIAYRMLQSEVRAARFLNVDL